MAWQSHEAKNQFSQVVRKAQEEGPQVVTLRGKPAVVVIAARDYYEMQSKRPTLVDDLLAGPRWDDAFAEAVMARAKLPSEDASSR